MGATARVWDCRRQIARIRAAKSINTRQPMGRPDPSHVSLRAAICGGRPRRQPTRPAAAAPPPTRRRVGDRRRGGGHRRLVAPPPAARPPAHAPAGGCPHRGPAPRAGPRWGIQRFKFAVGSLARRLSMSTVLRGVRSGYLPMSWSASFSLNTQGCPGLILIITAVHLRN